MDQATFDRVQALLSERRTGTPWSRRPYGKQTHPLAGITRCGTCGGNMHAGSVVRGSGQRHRYLRCAQVAGRGRTACAEPNARADRVEEQLLWYVAGMRLPAATLTRYAEAWYRRETAKRADTGRREAIQGRLERAKRLYLAARLTESEYWRETLPLEQELQKLAEPLRLPEMNWARQRMRDIGSMLAGRPSDEQRRFVHEVFERLVVHEGVLWSLTPKAAFVPLFVVDRRARFGQRGPDYPRVCVSVPPRGVRPPHTQTIPELALAA